MRQYLAGLSKISDLILSHVPEWVEPVWHRLVMRHPQRDALQRHLHAAEIGTLIHCPMPPHLLRAYQNAGWREGQFPLAEQLARSALSLPMGPHLVTGTYEIVIDEVVRFAMANQPAT